MEVINPSFMALAQPLFAIKRPGDTGALRISNEPSWIVDTAATIADDLQLDTKFDGLSMFGKEQKNERKRGHFIYQYKRSDWTDKYLSPIQEFSIDGKGVDSASWHEIAVHLPGGIEQKNQRQNSLWQTVKIQN
jgi:hypothetical protein